MNRTEEQLMDYFGAVADSVRAENTRPLASPRRHERRRVRIVFRHRRWQAWGAPLTAAVSMVAVISLAVTLGGLTTGHPSGAPPMAGSGVVPPRYYAQIDGSSTGGSVVVMSTLSGAVIAQVQRSALLQDAALPAAIGYVAAVAAAPDDRTFYVEMLGVKQVWIFKFSVNGPGAVSGITRIRGGVLDGAVNADVNPSLAVSPDGRSLALTTTSSAALAGINGHGSVSAVQDEIVVIDLSSGAHRTWHGGLYESGTVFIIRSLSWADHGQSLVFVPAWCDVKRVCLRFAGPGTHSQVRLLSASDDSGSLAASHVLLGAAVSAYDAVSDQDGNLDVLTLSGPESQQGLPMTVTVSQFSASTGASVGVLYQHAYQGHPYQDFLIGSYLAGDPSGMHLLFALNFDSSTMTNKVGWIDHGMLHPLKVGKDNAELLPDAW